MPFLTDVDSRAAIKGSRDPLGAQAIWTLLGRHVVGGLTTNTTSVRDFVVLLLGHWFIEKLDEPGSREEALPVFIRWEPLASYARLQAGDTGFRGTRPNLVLEIYDKRQCAIGTGNPFVSRLDPLPGDRRAAHGVA